MRSTRFPGVKTPGYFHAVPPGRNHTNILFAPLSTPLASGINTIASAQTNVIAAANGSFSVTLIQGNY